MLTTEGERALERLAERMAESPWQRHHLARIKGLPYYRFARIVFIILDKINCSNLYSYMPEQDHDHREETNVSDPASRVASSRIFGRGRPFTPAILATRLILVIYSFCTLGLLASICLQYNLDYYQFHLRRVASATRQLVVSDPPVGESNLGPLEGVQLEEARAVEFRLEQQVEAARQSLKWAGSFLQNHAFFAESVYILMELLCLLTYMGPIVFYNRRGPFDFHFIRLLIDWDQEQHNCNLLVAGIVEKIVRSSRNYMQIARSRLNSNQLTGCFKRESSQLVRCYANLPMIDSSNSAHPPPLDLTRSQRQGINKIPEMAEERHSYHIEWLLSKHHAYAVEHRWLVLKLVELALAGRLQPLDRCDIDRLARNCFCYASLAVIIANSCFCWNIVLFTGMLNSFGIYYETDLMDCVSMFELATLNVLLTIGGVFYLVLALVFCNEQVCAANKLTAMIKAFIRKHRQLTNGLLDSGETTNVGEHSISEQMDLYYDTINSELLLILMHYKILRAQLEPARSTFGFILFCCLGMCVVFPIIARLNLPYLQHKQSKMLAIFVCFLMMGLTDLNNVSMCWMNSRCLDLCHALWSLMALVVDISEHSELGSTLSEHSIWLLRKELSQPEHLKGQFAIIILGVEFTYTHFVKLHFWLGLLILSFSIEFRADNLSAASSSFSLSDSKTLHNFIFGGNFLNDPLGIISSFNI